MNAAVMTIPRYPFITLVAAAISTLPIVCGNTAAIRPTKNPTAKPTPREININTTTKKVMLAMGLGAPAIEMIINYRNGPDTTAGTKDDMQFTDIGSVANTIGLAPDAPDRTVLTQNTFTTKSDYFTIESRGTAGKSNITSRVACIVNRGDKKLLSFREY